MKNFQQTPKMRRVAIAGAKTQLVNSVPKAFQPRAAWESKRKIAGVAVDVLNKKQSDCGHPGVNDHYFFCPWR